MGASIRAQTYLENAKMTAELINAFPRSLMAKQFLFSLSQNSKPMENHGPPGSAHVSIETWPHQCTSFPRHVIKTAMNQ